MVINLKRYKQKHNQCAVAAVSSVANYYNPRLDYPTVEEIARKSVFRKLSDGLDAGQISCLLNILGFRKVTIVSSDLNFLDYGWNGLSQKRLSLNVQRMSKRVDAKYKDVVKNVWHWLSHTDYDNRIFVDFRYGDYIRKFLDRGNPLILSFNWTMYFRFPKDHHGYDDTWSEHAVAVCGYDKKGVNIVDSHHELYDGDLKEYRSGRYHMNWEHLMSVMGFGDLYLPEDYQEIKE